VHFKKRSRLRQAILSFCKKKNISLLDMYVDFPVDGSVRKELEKMLLETDQLHNAELRKLTKDREG